MMESALFTDIAGIKVGSAQDIDAAAGCTVILCEQGAVAGVDVRGGAPGTRETEILRPENLVQVIHAVLLTGGSAFGLDAAAGVMQYLEEKNIGFDAGMVKVPLVCGAVLFDLDIGDSRKRPDREMGYQASRNAGGGQPAHGNVGAGTGATVGKAAGMEFAMKGGLGSACFKAGDLLVGALVAVNCLGDVIDPENGRIVAGTLNQAKNGFADTEALLIGGFEMGAFGRNTTLGVVATNADLSKVQANRVATVAHNGIARSIRPAHTMFDGDTIFALATGGVKADVDVVNALAVRAVAAAITMAVRSAVSQYGLPCAADLV